MFQCSRGGHTPFAVSLELGRAKAYRSLVLNRRSYAFPDHLNERFIHSSGTSRTGDAGRPVLSETMSRSGVVSEEVDGSGAGATGSADMVVIGILYDRSVFVKCTNAKGSMRFERQSTDKETGSKKKDETR